MSKPGVRTFVWFLCLAACDAGAKPEPPSPPPAAAKPAFPAKLPSGDTTYDLTYLPGDSDLVVHVDVAMLRKSKLWPSYAGDVRKAIVPGFAGCAYDPLSEVATIDVGIALDRLSMFVFRGIDRDRSLACLRKTGTFDGDFVTLTNKTGSVHVVTFVDAHTMVVQGAKQPTKQTLQDALKVGADAPLRKDVSFVAAMAKAKTNAGMMLVSRPGSERMAKAMTTSGARLSYFHASLDLTENLSARYSMDVATADEAAQLAKMMNAQLDSPQVKALFDHSEARAQGVSVSIDLKMNEARLASLASMLRGMIPES